MPEAFELVDMAARIYQDTRYPDISAKLVEWAVEIESTEERLRMLTLYRIHSQEYEKALESAKKLENLRDPLSLNALALAEAANFDYAKAVEHYTLGLALQPDSMQLYANRAHVRLLAGEFKVGAADVVRALVVGWSSRLHQRDDPDLGEVKDYFGHVRRMNAKIAGADPAACRVLKVCAAIDEKYGHDLSFRLLAPLVQLGDLAWVRPALRSVCLKSQIKRGNDEVPDLQRALALKPAEVAVLIRLWGLTRLRHKTDEDLAPARRLIELCPEWVEPKRELAETLAWMERKEEALAQIESILQEDPEEVESLCVRAYLLRQKGDLRGALRDVEEAIGLTSADDTERFGTGEWFEGDWEIDRLVDRAELYGELGDDAAADMHFAKAMEVAEICDEAQEDDDDCMGRNVWGVCLSRARYYLERKRWKEALADYDLLLADGEKRVWGEFYEERAKAKEGLGDAPGAEADRQRAAEMKAEAEARGKKGRRKA